MASVSVYSRMVWTIVNISANKIEAGYRIESTGSFEDHHKIYIVFNVYRIVIKRDYLDKSRRHRHPFRFAQRNVAGRIRTRLTHWHQHTVHKLRTEVYK